MSKQAPQANTRPSPRYFGVRPFVREQGRIQEINGNTDEEDMQDRHKEVFEPQEPQGEASPQQKKGPDRQSWASEAQASSQTDRRGAVGMVQELLDPLR